MFFFDKMVSIFRISNVWASAFHIPFKIHTICKPTKLFFTIQDTDTSRFQMLAVTVLFSICVLFMFMFALQALSWRVVQISRQNCPSLTCSIPVFKPRLSSWLMCHTEEKTVSIRYNFTCLASVSWQRMTVSSLLWY